MSQLHAQDLVVISGEFGRYPSSIEHMIRQLAKSHRVLWIEVTGMRNPSINLYDLRRAAGKIARLVLGAQKVELSRSDVPSNLRIASPFTIPLPSSALVRRLNDRKLSQVIARETRRLGFERFGLITTLPLAARAFAEAKSNDICAAWTMYYCPDEWSLWPGMSPSLVRMWEGQLLRCVDRVVVPSDQLKKTKSVDGRDALLLPHGVDVEHFSQAYSLEPQRRIVFFGMFDERIDQALLASLAAQLPAYTVEVIGPVQALPAPNLPENIVFSGPVPYADLPARLTDAALLVLPYVRNELTDNINPLKGRECLATGKPVLATALPELVKMGWVFTASSHAEFIDSAKRILSGEFGYAGSAAIEAMRAHSWQSRAAELISFGQNAGPGPAH